MASGSSENAVAMTAGRSSAASAAMSGARGADILGVLVRLWNRAVPLWFPSGRRSEISSFPPFVTF